MNKSTILHMISGPRNISTAMMYSFGNRTDCEILDEPLYGYYLKETNADHPGKEEIIQSMDCDATSVFDTINNTQTQPYLFVKNMAHHFIGLDPKITLGYKNIFLIRNTRQILTSFSKVIKNPTIDDIGIKKEWELYQYLLDNNQVPVVIDTGLLLENPESVLSQLCDRLGISFQQEMLTWNAGPRTQDGIWAPYWYKNVHQTTGFKKQISSIDPLPDHLIDVEKEAYFYYEKLLASAIRP